MLLPHSRVFDPQTVAMMGHVADAAWAECRCRFALPDDDTSGLHELVAKRIVEAVAMASATLSGLSGKLLKRLMRDGPAA
jgi:hypothetical protein